MIDSPYLAIKRSIADGIAARHYVPGQALPSEHALCRTFGVARMTVNRAMRELAAEKLVRRVPGVGTFVAEPAAQSGLVELRNIADEIKGRGRTHTARVFALGTHAPDAAFGATPLYHSAIVHYEDGDPIQFEDRLVNPAIAPDYLRQDFTKTTPNEYLVRVAPLQEVAHDVQAIPAAPPITRHLALHTGEPVLLVTRRTWSANALAALTRLYHPGNKFILTGRFNPQSK